MSSSHVRDFRAYGLENLREARRILTRKPWDRRPIGRDTRVRVRARMAEARWAYRAAAALMLAQRKAEREGRNAYDPNRWLSRLLRRVAEVAEPIEAPEPVELSA